MSKVYFYIEKTIPIVYFDEVEITEKIYAYDDLHTALEAIEGDSEPPFRELDAKSEFVIDTPLWTIGFHT